MNASWRRTVDPLFISLSVELDQADLEAAFTDQLDPDEILFYSAFSDFWLTAPVSEKLEIMSKIARLAEDASLAGDLNLAAAAAEPKE